MLIITAYSLKGTVIATDQLISRKKSVKGMVGVEWHYKRMRQAIEARMRVVGGTG